MNKYILGLLALLVSAGAGYYLGTGNVQIEEKVIVKQGEDKIQIVERVVTRTVTIKPDGTRTETETTKDVTRDEQHSDTELSKDKTVTPILAQYSLGIRFSADYKDIANIYNDAQNKDNYTVQLGRRLLGPVWIEAGVGVVDYSLGVRWEF